MTGILYDVGLGSRQLASQAIGAAVIVFVMGAIAFAFFKIQNAVMKGGIRSEEADEIGGLDLPEMGALAYPEFEMAIEGSDPEIGHRPLVGSTRGGIHNSDALSLE